MAFLVLPFPPSTNNLFAGKSRRRVSKSYAAWRQEAALALLQQPKPETFAGPVALSLTFGRPDNRRRDLSNLAKAVEDLLVARGILADDSLVERLVLAWGPDRGCQVEIEAMAARESRGAAA